MWKLFHISSSWALKSLWMVKKMKMKKQKMIASCKKSYDKPRQCVEKQRHSANKGLYSQGYDLPSGHIWL